LIQPNAVRERPKGSDIGKCVCVTRTRAPLLGNAGMQIRIRPRAGN